MEANPHSQAEIDRGLFPFLPLSYAPAFDKCKTGYIHNKHNKPKILVLKVCCKTKDRQQRRPAYPLKPLIQLYKKARLIGFST